MKYRKKPVVIEAFRWTIDKVPDWFKDNRHITIYTSTGAACIPTLEGEMTAQIGDWIIQGVQGEIYPCKPDIFEKTYEEATDATD